MTEVTLTDVIKRYGQHQAVHGINLDIQDGEFVVLVGPSGCGKSTTLRMIAGLEDISGGEVKIGGRVVNDLPPRERNISMVFQNYALYPHMTVRENLGFSLKIAKRPEAEIERAVTEAAQILGLDELMERKPAALSGGQRQRVAMGRAIVRQPDVFLFDEPLSNLDAKLRTQMRVEIKKLHQKVGNTVIYVTHDQVEAMTLADRIVLMRDGHIVQTGTPLDLFNAPVDTFVATFIGSPPMNLVDGIVTETGALRLGDHITLPMPSEARGAVRPGQEISFGFRADNLMPDGHSVEESGQMAPLELEVALTEPLGTETLLFAEFAGREVQAKMLNPRPVQPGERLPFHLMLDKCHVFDRKSGKALRG
ncbi:sn-glycerol-3-phosphate ABC transporter ATP-binding protein UgpC [Rhodobacteraceae bacterium R_SAG7]|uniref:ABC transporter ATP-binding protein n=1 Tax=Ruegeria sp. (strain TM1040) TaxID=292414 RepID=UPI0000462CAA|nr:sn-glycerol-3-phosphate ABC transporter ATP-binding protein UgpC [Ruegeria sp. TM1040]ABF62368.1 ABC transporter-related protein [Ruegeria sp. TM1040]NKW78050.1 sn-glycerol-3-phosphate ABC transporter ATP-binding protein UgpC [Rhodobacteraceae bacterium R_SAG7]